MLLCEIEGFLRKQDMAVTKFGRIFMNDPRFVLDLRTGREPRPKTAARAREGMTIYTANEGDSQ